MSLRIGEGMMEDEMKMFYVTFGLGTFLRGRYQAIRAYNRDVVVAFMNKHYPKLWSRVLDTPPDAYEMLTPPDELHYQRAQDV